MITKQIWENSQHSFKRVKTEGEEMNLQNDMFSKIYANMKAKNPSLSVHSYFIACLHSTKETDMDLVNRGNSDTDISFAFY